MNLKINGELLMIKINIKIEICIVSFKIITVPFSFKSL